MAGHKPADNFQSSNRASRTGVVTFCIRGLNKVKGAGWLDKRARQNESPAGTTGNSLAFQRRVDVPQPCQVPQERPKTFFASPDVRSSLRDFFHFVAFTHG